MSTVVLGLSRSIKTWWYDKISVWKYTGPVPLVIFVYTANSFSRGNLDW